MVLLKLVLMAGILHTIVFHRALGLIRPKDIDLELFDITYVSVDSLSICFLLCYRRDVLCFGFDIVVCVTQVQCGEIEVEKKIDDKIEQIITWIAKHPNKKIQVYIFRFPYNSLCVFCLIFCILCGWLLMLFFFFCYCQDMSNVL